MRSTLKCDIMSAYIVGDKFMKTKIIYISGNEVFEMAEIRAAFEEVRTSLGLSNDTILFGVPVDSDCALATPVAAPHIKTVEPVTEPVPEIIPDVVVETTENIPVESTAPVVESAPEIESVVDVTPEPESEPDYEPEKVIPILSILSVQEDSAPEPELIEPVADEATEGVAAEAAAEVADDVATTTEPVQEVVETAVISDVSIDDVFPVSDDATDDDATPVTIGDMVADQAPVAPMEKTLEQLLESMTPLREDVQTVDTTDTEPDITDVFDADDADATLARLANEFADTQDKIPAAPRSEGQSKIGKLKNILPFKKVKNNDSGIIGDLFGWAGTAANDDDFSLPGFFTPATSKKQGA